MIIVCPNCNTRFELNERQVGGGNRKLRCAFCQHAFYMNIPLPEGEETTPGNNLEENPELLGTLLLNLWNKPKKKMEEASPNKNKPLADQTRALPRATAPGEVVGAPGEETAVGEGHASRGLSRIMLSDIQKAGMIFKTRWAAALEWGDIKLIAPYWDVFRAAEGVTLFREGDHNPFLCLIFLGEVRLTGPGAELKHGPKHPLMTVGDCFGELVLFSSKPRACTATAEKETYFMVLTKKRFREMGEREPRLWQGVMRLLISAMCQHIQDANGHQPDFLVKT